MHCSTDEQVPISIKIEVSCEAACFKIDEVKGYVQKRGELEPVISGLPIQYQSQLTSTVVSDLLTSGRCSLTPFAESSALHLPFIQSLLTYFQKDSAGLEYCPIT